MSFKRQYPVKTAMGARDTRYTIDIEYSGADNDALAPGELRQGQTFVARFCGEAIGFYPHLKKARLEAIKHDCERLGLA